MQASIFIGADIGTQGVRVAALQESGEVAAAGEADFPLDGTSMQEQSPHEWWEALENVLLQITDRLKQTVPMDAIKAMSVTSTSGTMIPLDEHHQPLHPAIMYSDKRSAQEAMVCREIAANEPGGAYKVFNSSCGLPKILWFLNQYPKKAEKIKRWVHAADFILGKLCGQWGITDHTNALKTGYDLQREQWPEYLFSQLKLPREWFPAVVSSGTLLGKIDPMVAERTGLPKSLSIVAGMTDGCASQLSSGAIHPGDWNTTIGTTLVVKGVVHQPIQDPEGRVYNHRHPEGFWMPGGASNTGAEWVSRDFQGQDLNHLTNEARKLIPTLFLAYPLRQNGERFPFISDQARGFEPNNLSNAERFAANMEGVAYIERLTYDLIESLSGERVRAIYTAGGASDNNVWLTIRSNVLKRTIYKMKYVSGAVGAAVLAASRTEFTHLREAGAHLIHPVKETEPSDLASVYEDRYQRFVQELKDRGYLQTGGISLD